MARRRINDDGLSRTRQHKTDQRYCDCSPQQNKVPAEALLAAPAFVLHGCFLSLAIQLDAATASDMICARVTSAITMTPVGTLYNLRVPNGLQPGGPSLMRIRVFNDKASLGK